ncbi:hypothetical protein M3Y99_01899500 [Aphelenchoides fujianensis]|nr:hypothetical protein M3Y99_01899500 [Aphelenchoides fujianensis]
MQQGRLVQWFVALLVALALFETAAALPIGLLVNEEAPSEPQTIELTPFESSAGAEDDPNGPLVFVVPSAADELNLRLERALGRARRSNHVGQTSAIDYKTLWPILNAAKSRAAELVNEGHRIQAAARHQQSVTKREWVEPEERLARFSRNLPVEQDKLLQIRTVGDLPMFRFG